MLHSCKALSGFLTAFKGKAMISRWPNCTLKSGHRCLWILCCAPLAHPCAGNGPACSSVSLWASQNFPWCHLGASVDPSWFPEGLNPYLFVSQLEDPKISLRSWPMASPRLSKSNYSFWHIFWRAFQLSVYTYVIYLFLDFFPCLGWKRDFPNPVHLFTVIVLAHKAIPDT